MPKLGRHQYGLFSQLSMDKESPNSRLLDIESEITQCRGELAGLSQIIDEVEGGLGRVSHT